MSVRPAAGQSGRGQEVEVPTATKDDLELVRTVFQIVVRQFYQDQHAILIDVLSKHLVMPSETLAKALGVSVKEMLQVANQLIRDRLIHVHRRMETRESGPSNYQKALSRSYLYLDRKLFLDVVKWRIMKMRSQIDSVLRNELDNKGYMCPRCGKAYNTLDVAALLDPVTMLTFVCDMPGCGSELVDNEDAEDVRRSRDRLQRFNVQCGPILDRLRKLDTVALPHFDYLTEINRKGDSDAWIQRALQRGNTTAPRGAIGIATGGALAGSSVKIDMISTNPEIEAQRRLEREAEAARMRQENAMPIWLQETQDPKMQRLRTQEEQDAALSRVDDVAQASSSQIAADQAEYLAQYASMAQEEEGEDDLELENVTDKVGDPSQSATPQTNGKRSREESSGEDENSKRVKDDENADEDDYDLEEVA